MAIKLVTFSASKRTGDKSFSHGVFQIVAENKSHYRVRAIKDIYWKGKGDQLLLKDDYIPADVTPLLCRDEKRSMLCMASVSL